MSDHSAGDSADNIVPFGKYRGQPVAVMLADRGYCEWALAQPGIRERYPTFVTIVVNGGSAPDAPTPEHNRLQLLFRDPAMRAAAYCSVIGEKIKEAARSTLWENDASVLAAGESARQAVLARNAEIALVAAEDFAHAADARMAGQQRG